MTHSDSNATVLTGTKFHLQAHGPRIGLLNTALAAAAIPAAGTAAITGCTFSNTDDDLQADLTGSLAPAVPRCFWIRVLVN